MTETSIPARLAAPAARYRSSYLEALREGFRRGIQPAADERRIDAIEGDFAGHLRAITDQSGMVSLPTGEVVPKVPHSLLWLVEGDQFIGEVSIRHELNAYLMAAGGHIGYGIRPSRQGQGCGKLILALALEECRRLGIERVLVTCAGDHLASVRIIEANGGRLDSAIDDPAGRGRLRRYWISL
jgi:predicted acetyltransferase